MKRFAILAGLAAVACGGATAPYDKPYALIEVDPVRAADPLVIPVILNRVDDRNAIDPRWHPVAPGRHRVVVDVPPRAGFHLPTENTFEVATEPCVRYYIAARLVSTVTQPWTPFVRSTDRITECEHKFGLTR